MKKVNHNLDIHCAKVFLTSDTTKQDYFMKRSYTLRPVTILFFLLLLCGPDRIFANRNHESKIPLSSTSKFGVPDYKFIKDTVQPVSEKFPGKASKEEFKKRALAK